MPGQFSLWPVHERVPEPQVAHAGGEIEDQPMRPMITMAVVTTITMAVLQVSSHVTPRRW
jgi:hypothetical protein